MPMRRFVALSGCLLALAGLGLQVYFDSVYDTWLLADASAPPGLEVPGDPREAVLYPSEQRQARARDGARLGRGVAAAGALLMVGGLLGARRRAGGGEP